MPQVPRTIPNGRSSVRAEDTAQASTSNKPPATGVPSARPVNRAASAVTAPQTSDERHSGGSFSCNPANPNASRISASYSAVVTFNRLVPDISVSSAAARPVSRRRM